MSFGSNDDLDNTYPSKITGGDEQYIADVNSDKELRTNARGHIEFDAGNSTDTPLLDGQEFPGTWTQRKDSEIIVAGASDQSFTFYIQFANSQADITAGNIDSSIPYNFNAGAVNVPQRLVMTREFYRIRIINDSGSDMTYLRFQTSVGNFDKLETDRVDLGNSSNDLLLAGEEFTGFGADVLGSQQINTSVYADQNSAENGLIFQFSSDGVNWRTFRTFTYVAGTFRTFQWGRYFRYYRVRFINGSVDQTEMDIQTLLLPGSSPLTIHRVGDIIDSDRTVELVKAAITAQQPDGDFVNGKADGISVDVNGNQIKTTTPLAAGAEYTSGWADTDGFKGIEVTVKSDQISAVNGLIIEYTDDANAVTPSVVVDKIFTFSEDDLNEGSLTVTVPPLLDGYRVRYINGITPQAEFNLEATLRTAPTQAVTLPIRTSVNGGLNAGITRSIGVGRNPDDIFQNVRLNGKVSSASTSTPLLIGGTFDSGIVNCEGYTQVTSGIKTDQSGIFKGSWYADEAGTTLLREFTVPYTPTDDITWFSAPVLSPYIKIEFENNSGIDQTQMYLQFELGTNAKHGQMTNLDSFLPTNALVNVGRSIGVGLNPDGLYENVRKQGIHTANSSTIPLPGNSGGTDHIWRGEWFNWQKEYIKAITDVSSDVSGTFYIDLSQEDNPIDGDESSVTESIVLPYNPIDNPILRRQTPIQSKWFRLRYVNGLAAQSFFSVDCAFTTSDPGLVTQPLASLPNDFQESGIVRSIPAIPDIDNPGEYKEVPVSLAGNPEHSVKEIHDDVLLKPLTIPKASQVTVGTTPTRIDPEPIDNRRGTLIKNTGLFSCSIGFSDSITFNSESYVMNPGDNLVLPFSEAIPLWAIAQDSGGSETTLNRNGSTATGTATNPANALTSNNVYAIIDANTETVEVSGFTAGTTNDLVSVGIGIEASKESGQTQTVSYIDTETGNAGNVGTVATTNPVTASSDYFYVAAISRENANALVTEVIGLGLTWVQLTTVSNPGSNDRALDVWYAQGTPSGDSITTASFSQTATNAHIAVSSYMNVNTSSPFADSNFTTGSTTTVTSAAMTGIDKGISYLAVAKNNTNFTPGAGYTELSDETTATGNNRDGLATEIKLLTATASETATGTLNTATDWAAISFILNPADAIDPTIEVSYELSAVAGTTTELVTISSTTDTDYLVDITSDRSWVFSDIANVEAFVTGSDIGGAAAQIDRVYIQLVDTTGNVTKLSIIQGGEELL